MFFYVTTTPAAAVNPFQAFRICSFGVNLGQFHVFPPALFGDGHTLGHQFLCKIWRFDISDVTASIFEG